LAYYDQKWKNRITNTIIFNPPACTVAGTQLTAACPLSIGGAGSAFGNDAKIKGIEFSADALVAKDWTVGVNLDYKEATWDKYYYASQSSRTPGAAILAANAYSFDGNELGKVPKITGSLTSTYRKPSLVGDWSGYVRGDLAYTGAAWESDYNFAKTDAYYRVNLRLGMEKKNVSLELFVKNLFDDNSWNYAYRLSNLAVVPLTSFSQQGVSVSPADPREVGLRASFSF
jgi:iron complex outermembrane receptor protein